MTYHLHFSETDQDIHLGSRKGWPGYVRMMKVTGSRQIEAVREWSDWIWENEADEITLSRAELQLDILLAKHKTKRTQ